MLGMPEGFCNGGDLIHDIRDRKWENCKFGNWGTLNFEFRIGKWQMANGKWETFL